MALVGPPPGRVELPYIATPTPSEDGTDDRGNGQRDVHQCPNRLRDQASNLSIRVRAPAGVSQDWNSTGERMPGSLPPGPRMPAAAQAWEWTRNPLPFLDRCRREYGDAFTLRISH